MVEPGAHRPKGATYTMYIIDSTYIKEYNKSKKVKVVFWKHIIYSIITYSIVPTTQ